MIYLIYSAEPEMARRSALKVLKRDFPERNDSNYISLNMAVSSVKEIVEECDMLPLGVDRKAVFAENCSFLEKNTASNAASAPKKGSKKGKAVDKDLESLALYCLHPNEIVDLFLVVYSDKIDEANPVFDAVKKTGKLMPAPVPEPSQWVDYAMQALKKRNCPCDREIAQEIVNRVHGDYGRFLIEITKLSIYANGEPLTLNAVNTLVSPWLEDNAFEISNALLMGNTAKVLSIYHDLKTHSIDEVRLLNLLANQLRFLEQVQYLSHQGFSSNSIANELGCKPGRVNFALRNLSRVRQGSLKIAQEQIYRSELAILSGEEAPQYAFEKLVSVIRL